MNTIITPAHIHKIASKLQIPWDGDEKFMKWCKQQTGYEHLDGMSDEALLKIFILLILGKYPEELKEGDLYLHRGQSSQYVTPEKTRKLKTKLSRIHVPNTGPEEPKYSKLKIAATKLRKRLSSL